MAHGGKREGSGRKKGSQNKRTLETREYLDSIGCNPIEGLAHIAMGKSTFCRITLDKEQGDFIEGEVKPNLDQIILARKTLAEYYAPKLKAVEHSGAISLHEESLDDLA
jgi:hypothetical protein